MYKINVNGNKYPVYFKEISDSEEDTDCVVKWRNTNIARESFFIPDVVTPDVHRNFIRNKKFNDIIFMVYNENNERIGMTAVIVDTKNKTGEYGRTYIDEKFRGNNYAYYTELLLMSYSFDILNLDYLWLDAFVSNDPIIKLHYKTGWSENKKYYDIDNKEIVTMEIFKKDWRGIDGKKN